MAHRIQLPFDVLEMIILQVDDFETLRELQYTSTTLARLAERGFWENLHLTSYLSVIGAFWAILRKPRIRNMVRSIRLPDIDGGNGPSWRFGPAPAIDASDIRVLTALNLCSIFDADPRNCRPYQEGWSTSEAMVAAMMLLCPNMDTVVADSYARRTFVTLCHILERVDQYCPSLSPRIQCWKITPDTLTTFYATDELPVDPLRFFVFPCKRLDLIPYPELWQFNEPIFPVLSGVEDLRLNDNLFEFDNYAGCYMTTFPGESNYQMGPFVDMARLFDSYVDFIERSSFELQFGAGELRRLHWKLTAPIFYDVELEEDEHADVMDDNFEGAVDHIQADGTVLQTTAGDFSDNEVEFMLDMPNVQTQQAEAPLQVESQGDDTLMADITDPAPCIIEPSLYCVRFMQNLVHLETNTGAMFGMAGCLFEQSYFRSILPHSLEVLVLEERWYRGCEPVDCLLGLYRWRLFWELYSFVEGRIDSRLERVVFIPDPDRNYWPGMSERVEWDRAKQVRFDPFAEMRVTMEEQGGRRAAENGRRMWREIRPLINVVF